MSSIPLTGAARSTTWKLLGVWALIVLAVVYLTVAGGGALGLYLVQFRVVSVAIVFAAAAAWLVLGLRQPFWRPRSQLTPAILAAAGTLAISVAGSAQPRLGLDFVAYGVLLALSYWLLQRLFAHPFFGPRLGVLGVLLGFGISGMYIAVVFYRWIQFWSDVGRVVAPPLRPAFEGLAYGNPGAVAAVVILLWLASAAHLGTATPQRRWILSVLGLMSATAVFLTGSRAAWAGLGGAVVIVGGLWLASAQHRDAARSIVRSRAFRGAVIAGLFAGAVVAAVFFPVVARRLGEPAADTRTAFAVASARMFGSHPLTGVGPGMWVVDRIRFTEPPEVDYYIPHAHNIALQTAAELGVVGAIAAVFVLFVLARLLFAGIRSSDPLTSRLGWAALLGGVYLLGHQMFDVFAPMPAVGFCYALIVARLDARVSDERRIEPSPRSHRFVAPALAGALVLSTVWLGRTEAVAVTNDRAVSAANEGDWQAAQASASAAVADDPTMPPYLFTLGLAEAHAGDLAAALEHIRASADVDDYPIAWLDVARLALDLGRPDEARHAAGEALRLGYQQPEVAFGVSTIDLELGDEDGAVAALAAAFVAAPGFASDPTWGDPTRRTLFDAAVDAALAQASPGVGYKIALEAGRLPTALALVDALPLDQRLVPGLVARAWGADDAAFDQLHRLAMEDPLDTETVSLCRRVAARSHDAEWIGARSWTCSGAGAPGALIVVRIGPPPTWRVYLPGPDFSWHFEYVYRRFAPWDELVPGLPHLYTLFV